MKVSLNWVKEYTDINLPVDELVEKIGAQLGAVEEVINLGNKYQGIVIAKVVTCEKHPDADKLNVCAIDDGGITPDVKRDELGHVQVVCGAPNVRADMLVAWLPPGTVVPSSLDKDPFKLEAREIRGVVSNGMLASASELTISEDHTGILELSFGKPGQDFAEEFGLNDYIIDIENKMFTHRPDLFGILGVAREIAGITGRQFKSPEWYVASSAKKQKVKSDHDLDLEVKNPITKLVPRFMAQVIENVDIKPSPVWMQAYLSRVGIRPINNIVDVTNYAMYLTAQPLHAYDYDKLCKVASTRTARLETRLSRKGDKLRLLNGKAITFENDATILITSNDIPVGIGGVMGGADTEVDENTKNIVLECANFDMYSIRRTSMRLGVFTDAVTRFNKGQSYLQTAAVLDKTAAWTTQLTGGKPGKVIDDYQKLQPPIAVHLTADFINARLGLKLDIKEMAKLLTNVEFEVAHNGPNLVVTPPFWRTDIEIPEDVVEEAGRLYGYDHLSLELPNRDLTPAKKEALIELKNGIREVLTAAGANELLNYSFVHGKLIDKVGQDRDKAFQLSNALSPDLQYYRLSLAPSLLEKVHPNIKAGHSEFAIFELGKAHLKGEQDAHEPDVPKEVNCLSLIFSLDDKMAKSYAGSPYYTARKYLDSLLSFFNADRLVRYEPLHGADLYHNQWLEQIIAPFEPKRSAVLRDEKDLVWGVVGEFRPEVKKALKLPNWTAGFELDPLLVSSALAQTSYTPLSRFPRVEQDISLKLSAKLSYAELYDFIRKTVDQIKPRHATATLTPIDIYQRDNDQEHQQITFRLSIASYERTLTDREVNKLLDDVASAAHKKFGATRI